MADSEQIRRSDVIAADVFTQPAEEAKALLVVLSKLEEGFKTTLAQTAKGLGIGSPQSAAEVQKLAATIKDLEDKIKALNATQAQKGTIQQRINDLDTAAAKANIDLNQQLKEKTKAINDEVRATKAQVGSIEELRLKTNQLVKERDKLGDVNGKNKAQFDILSKSIKENTDKLKSHDEQIGRSQREVGNYGKALDKLPAAFQGGIASLKAFGAEVLDFLKNPFVLAITGISAAVYGLYSAFTSTREGAKTMKEAFVQIEATMGVLQRRTGELALGIFHLFTDPKQAMKDFANAFSDVGAAIELARQEALKYRKDKAELDKKEDAEISERARIELDRTKALLRSKENISKAEKKQSLLEYIKLGDDLIAFDKSQAEKNYQISLRKYAGEGEINQKRILAEKAKIAEIERLNTPTVTIGGGGFAQGREIADPSQRTKEQADKIAAVTKVSNAKIYFYQKEAAEKLSKLIDGNRSKQSEELKNDSELKRAYNLLNKDKITELETLRAKIYTVENEILSGNKRAIAALTALEKEFNDKSKEVRDKKAALDRAEFDEIQANALLRIALLEDGQLKEVGILNIKYNKLKYGVKEGSDELLLLEENFLKEYAAIKKKHEDEDAAIKKKNEDEDAKLKAQNKLEVLNLKNVDSAKLDELKQQQRKELDIILAGAKEGIERRNEIVQSGIQKELTQTERAIEKQQQLAADGLENTLAYQEKRRAEMEAKAVREKEAARQKEEAIQLAGAYLSAYRARMDKGNQTSTAALSGALSDVLLAKAISSSVAGAFAEGVEDFQGKGTGTSDSNLIAFSHGESVVTAKATKQYSGLVTAMNKGFVDDYINEMIMPDLDARPSSNGGSFSSAAIVFALTKEMGELRQAIKNKQEIKVNWDAQGARVEEIVKDGMRVVTKHVTTGKRRL